MNCPPKIKIESYFFDNKADAETASHLQSCPHCQEALKELDLERRAFLQKYPFESFWNRMEKRKSSGWDVFWQKVNVFGNFRTAAAMASIVGLMVFAVWRFQQPTTLDPQLLTKGGTGLIYYTATPGGETALGKDRAKLPAGSDLQFVYSSPKEPYLIFVGVEADKTISVYFPTSGSLSAPATVGERQALPNAVRWQPKSSYERFYAIFSNEPVHRDAIQSAVERSGKSIEDTPKLPLPYTQASLILYKK